MVYQGVIAQNVTKLINAIRWYIRVITANVIRVLKRC